MRIKKKLKAKNAEDRAIDELMEGTSKEEMDEVSDDEHDHPAVD